MTQAQAGTAGGNLIKEGTPLLGRVIQVGAEQDVRIQEIGIGEGEFEVLGAAAKLPAQTAGPVVAKQVIHGNGELPHKFVLAVVTHAAVGHAGGFVDHIYLQVDVAVAVDRGIVQFDIRLEEAQVVDVLLGADQLRLPVVISRGNLQLPPQNLFLGALIACDVDLPHPGAGAFADVKMDIELAAVFLQVRLYLRIDEAFLKVFHIDFGQLGLKLSLVKGFPALQAEVFQDRLSGKALIAFHIDAAKSVFLALCDADDQLQRPVAGLPGLLRLNLHVDKAVFLVEGLQVTDIGVELFLFKTA